MFLLLVEIICFYYICKNCYEPGEKCKYNFECKDSSHCINFNNNNICSAGLDGKNPVSLNLDNGKFHYIPINTSGCRDDTRFKCPPNYLCNIIITRLSYFCFMFSLGIYSSYHGHDARRVEH